MELQAGIRYFGRIMLNQISRRLIDIITAAVPRGQRNDLRLWIMIQKLRCRQEALNR